jgi:hypothetical protein
MLLRSFILYLFVLPIILSWTIIEEIYLTKDMMNYFEEELLDDEEGGAKSDEKSSEIEGTMRIASLLSTLDTTSRADHYWTRLGHRRRTSTLTPVNSWDYYYIQYPWYSYNNFLSRRRKRSAENEKDAENVPRSDVEILSADQNKTTEGSRPMLDFRLRKGL